MVRVVVALIVLVAACGGSHAPSDAGPSDGAPRDASGMDAPFDAEPGPIVPCTYMPFPETGRRCDPAELSSQHVCRYLRCESLCYSTCRCLDGRWACGDECRDPAPVDGGRLYCGAAPRCFDFLSCIAVGVDGPPAPCYADADCSAGDRCDGADAGPRDFGACVPR